MESDVEESLRKRPRKYPFSVDSSSRKQFEQFGGRPHAVMGEVNFMQDDGIQLEITWARCEPCELYHCVLESKSFLEKMTDLEPVPFFVPILESENDLLSSNAMVRLIEELYGNQIGELYHSLPYHIIEFVLDDFDWKVTVSLRCADLISVLPTRITVLAWPMHQFKKNMPSTATLNRKEDGIWGSHPAPIRLTYAEDALRTMSLPEAYAEIVLNLPQTLQQMFQQSPLDSYVQILSR